VSAQLALSPQFPLPGAASPPTDVAMPCHTSFPWSQDEIDASASSSRNASSGRLHSRAETEALNLHHHCWPPFLNCLTPTLHCYKNVISILATVPTTQPRLHFGSSLARAPCHRSYIYRCRSLSSSSHTNYPSVQ
jgi:hypothetical protein